MKIKLIKFKDDPEQAWISLELEGEYVGTLHVVNSQVVKYLREKNPKELNFSKSDEK